MNMDIQPARHVASRTVTLMTIAALVLPVIAIAAYILDRYQLASRLRLELMARHHALSVVDQMDRDLSRLVAIAQTLAMAPSIHAGEFSTFRQQALQVRDMAGVDVILSSHREQVIVDTRPPGSVVMTHEGRIFSEELSRINQPRVVRLLSDSHQKGISFAVIAAVARPDTVELTHQLALVFPIKRFQTSIEQDELPGMVVTVFDRDGAKLISTNESKDIVERPGKTSDFEKAVHDWSVAKVTGVDGRSVVTGYARSQVSDWLVAVDGFEEDFQRPLHRDDRNFKLAGLMALVTMGLSGFWLVRRLRRRNVDSKLLA
jgi:hypothetical protein